VEMGGGGVGRGGRGRSGIQVSCPELCHPDLCVSSLGSKNLKNGSRRVCGGMQTSIDST